MKLWSNKTNICKPIVNYGSRKQFNIYMANNILKLIHICLISPIYGHMLLLVKQELCTTLVTLILNVFLLLNGANISLHKFPPVTEDILIYFVAHCFKVLQLE